MVAKSKTSSPQKKATGRKSVSRRKKSSSSPMSMWAKACISLATVFLFSIGFYFFFIRPYAYRWKPCYGQKGYGVCLPCDYEVHGIDISHYQGKVDWKQLQEGSLAQFPVCFVFIKATEGGDLMDDTFVGNFDAARTHGLIRGAYHFFQPATDAGRQADFFIKNVQLQKGDLPPVLDVEVSGKKTPSELKDSVKIWLEKVEAHYRVKPILYTSYKFRQRFLNDSVFDSYPYWIAHYYVDSVKYKGKWHFWQHTDVGRVPGIKKEVDLNVFNGSFEQLMEMTLKE